MPNFKVVGNATGLTVGSVISQKDIDDRPGLGGTARLLDLKAIEITSDPVTSGVAEPNSNLDTGEPAPLNKNITPADQAAMRGSGDAAEKAHPAKGVPGAVKPAAKKSEE